MSFLPARANIPAPSEKEKRKINKKSAMGKMNFVV